ncbi:hypothetical protein [Streptomyces sp. 8N706]|uniref:hypothetical protein n=1 Tax=Streptomyces sp. 8N706 TaxID=3457416 RepID=UPI003FD0F8E4
MENRSLEALGYTDAPAERPLTYPGRPLSEPGLLTGRELLPLGVRRRRLGAWHLDGPGPARELDEALGALGQAGTGRRHPVIAVGSNASPAQLGHKLARLGLPSAVPMVPVRVCGIAVGCSGHISRAGYVARTPYVAEDPEAGAPYVVSWLDPLQLKGVDDTEFPNYRRALLPGDRFPMTLPSGERLGGAYLYVSTHGALAGRDGRPLPGTGTQAALLTALLHDSPRLRQLLGPGPQDWVRRAGADPELRRRGTRLLAAEGRVLPQTDFLPYLDDSAEPYLYDDLPPLGGSLPTGG